MSTGVTLGVNVHRTSAGPSSAAGGPDKHRRTDGRSDLASIGGVKSSVTITGLLKKWRDERVHVADASVGRALPQLSWSKHRAPSAPSLLANASSRCEA